MNNDQNQDNNQQLNILNSLNNPAPPVNNPNPVPPVNVAPVEAPTMNPAPVNPVPEVTAEPAPATPITLNPETATENNQPSDNVADSFANNMDDNRFINPENTVADTSLTDLNGNGTYNNNVAPDYTSDPQVRQNIQERTKKTVPITKELKTVIVIAFILLLVILFMPNIFDAINKIRFR